MQSAQAGQTAARDSVEVTKAQQDEARAQLAELQTRSPRPADSISLCVRGVDGTFSNRLVNVATHRAGQRLGNVVPLNDVFIDANFAKPSSSASVRASR